MTTQATPCQLPDRTKLAANALDQSLLLTSKTACIVLALSPRKLWGLTASGEIPHIRISNRCIRYSIDDLRDWIAKNRNGGE